MGSLKMVFGIFTIVAVVYLIAELAPPFFSNYQFEDAIKTEAQMGTYSTKGDDTIRDAVYKKAQELNVPVVREQIKITRVGSAYNGSVTIEAPYTVHLSLPGYPLDLNFDPSSTNRSVF
jgi:hypothetical protein